MIRQLKLALFGAFTAAFFAAFGDWLWVWFPGPHPRWIGVSHGLGMFLVVGVCLGIPLIETDSQSESASKIWQLSKIVSSFIASAFVGATAFYGLYAALPKSLGREIMIGSWMLIWILSGLCFSVIRNSSWQRMLSASLIAAILSGLAFYFLIVPIWTRHEVDPSFLDHGLRWLGCYLPAFVAYGLAAKPQAGLSSEIRG